MLFSDSLRGMVRVRITCADVECILHKLISADIIIKNVDRNDIISVDLTIYKKNFHEVERIVDNEGGKIEILEKIGMLWHISVINKRPVLILGIAFYIVLAAFIPTRVFFVQIEGNRLVTDTQIMDMAQNAGIKFGTSRRSIRSEKVKNALLGAIPQLQWVGVNTRGCVATISVKERSTTEKTTEQKGISSIVAGRDGIVDTIVATRGNVVCKVGQAVKADQVLISGYTDCGISIKVSSAAGEVYARTSRDLNVISPLECTARGHVAKTETKFSLIFGKKQINLYKDSGISGSSCVKMYKRFVLTLPGGFQLPISVMQEMRTYYESQKDYSSEEEAYAIAKNFANRYLNGQMVAGEVLSSSDNAQVDENILEFHGEYICREMIGKYYEEEIIDGNEQRDRKNR